MTDKKIKQIINNIKLENISRNEIKAELSELLAGTECVQAKSLLALLFGEAEREDMIRYPEGCDHFLAIVNGNVLNPGSEPQKKNLLIYKNRIIATSIDLPDSLPDDVDKIYVIDAEGLIITPGLIDQHIHGGYGHDFNVANVEGMVELSQSLPEHGITSILPTLMTAPINVIKEQINKIAFAGKQKPDNTTRFLGIHLEGPFLNPKYKGIHPESEILIPNIENFKKLENSGIKIVTFAPELDKDLELTGYLVENNIIPSAGHSGADNELVNNAEKLGLKQVTHLFNAMTPLHHRNPGIIGESLVNDNLYAEIIADGMHVHPIILELILRSKPDSKVIFISDSLPLNQAKSNSVIFGGQEIFKQDNKAVNDDGTFAGSLMFLDSILRNILKTEISDFSQFLKFASLNPAQNLGLDDFGYIAKDKIADIVIWNSNKDYTINTTIINGKIAFRL